MPRPHPGLSLILLAGWLSGPVPDLAAQTAGEPPAEPPAATAPAPSPDQLHDELRAVRAAVETAINERDIDGLLEHVTPDVVFTAMTGEVGRGKDGVRDYFSRMLEGESPVFSSVTMSFEPDALSILYGGDTAISFGNSPGRYEFADGKVMDVVARWTTTLVRRDGAWKIAAVHTAASLFDNPVLEAQRKVLIRVAAAALAIVALLAFFAGRALGRRSAAR